MKKRLLIVLLLFGCNYSDNEIKVRSIKNGTVFVTQGSTLYKVGDTMELGTMATPDKCVIISVKSKPE